MTPAGKAIFQQFDQIYVISLKKRTDRRKEISEQFQKLGFDIDHPKVTVFDAISPAEANGFPSPGARGCYLSHLGCLEDAEAKGFGPVLVTEDDMDFAPDFEARAPDVLATLSKTDWNVFYLGYHANDRFVAEFGAGAHDIGKRFLVLGSHAIGFAPSTRRDLITFLKDRIPRIEAGEFKLQQGHVDGVKNVFRYEMAECSTIVAVPGLADQRRSKSDILAHKRIKRLLKKDFYRSLIARTLGR